MKVRLYVTLATVTRAFSLYNEDNEVLMDHEVGNLLPELRSILVEGPQDAG